MSALHATQIHRVPMPVPNRTVCTDTVRLDIIFLDDKSVMTRDLPADQFSSIYPDDLGLGPNDAFRCPAAARRDGVPDVVRSEKLPNGYHVTATSLEAAAFQMLACDAQITRIVPRAHVLSYPFKEGGRTVLRTFVPDFVFVRTNGEVSALALAPSWEPGANGSRRANEADAIRAAYKRHRVGFLKWSEHKPFARHPRRNREFMLRRAPEATDADLQRVRAALALHGLPTTVKAVHRRAKLTSRPVLDRVLDCLMNLALRGEVGLDLSKPFDGTTRVTKGALA
ncbi:hypothetical protein [Enterovirga sp. CN4-39]|uniref:hypothetical protein n=1 Tax=Enterovirga sp. CN4-39 TaxID=3400910 RepID=UPI003C083911